MIRTKPKSFSNKQSKREDRPITSRGEVVSTMTNTHRYGVSKEVYRIESGRLREGFLRESWEL